MRNKILLLLFIFTVTILLNAEYIEIGTEELTTYDTPVCGVYDFGWSESLYRQHEIGESKVIYQLAYNVSNNPSYYTLHNQKIYLKNYPDTLITQSLYSFPESNGYQLVFNGDITFNGNWNTITLDNPFTYDGVNSLNIVWINNDGAFNSGCPEFYHYNTYYNPRIKYANSDNAFPYGNGNILNWVPCIRLYYYDSSAPVVPFDIYPMAGQSEVPATSGLYWQNGVSTDTNIVYFGDSEEDLDIIYTGPAKEEVTNYELSGMLEQGETYFWKVDAENEHGATTSGVKSFTTENTEFSNQIGIGTSVLGGLPWDPVNRYSYTQSLYRNNEIAFGDVIKGLSYFWTGYSVFSNHIRIYMGNTTESSFTNNNSWLLEDELTLVFDGIVSNVDSHTWLRIDLDEPFVLQHDKSLVIACLEDTNLSETNADNFRCTPTASSRSLYFSSDSVVPSIATPPAGDTRYFLPNTKIHFLDSETVNYLDDGFEDNNSFDHKFTPWLSLDLDQSETLSYSESTFPGDTDPKGFIVLDPYEIDPIVGGTNPHNGTKMVASLPSVNGNTDDWLISPLFDTPLHYIGDLDSLLVTFYAKSHILSGEEVAVMNIKYSDGSANPNEFVYVQEYPSSIQVRTDWTEYRVAIPIPDSEQIRLAIQSITIGNSILYIDDVYAFISLISVPNNDENNPEITNNLRISNYPNPFNPSTTLSFTIKESNDVKISIFNILGQEIDVVTDKFFSAGTHLITWNGVNSDKQPVSSGVYFYRIESGKNVATGKMVLLK